MLTFNGRRGFGLRVTSSHEFKSGRGSLRRFAAGALLCVMAVNFTAEGLTLLLVRSAEFKTLFSQMVTLIASDDTPGGLAQGSCCAVPPEVVKDSCGCSCCGDKCPMGDACQCGPDGQPAMPVEGLFFRLPSCHLSGPGSADMLPLSLSVEYLIAGAAAPHQFSYCFGVVADFCAKLTSVPRGPVVPPPRRAAA